MDTLGPIAVVLIVIVVIIVAVFVVIGIFVGVFLVHTKLHQAAPSCNALQRIATSCNKL